MSIISVEQIPGKIIRVDGLPDIKRPKVRHILKPNQREVVFDDYVRVGVPSDGDCLFHSFALCLLKAYSLSYTIITEFDQARELERTSRSIDGNNCLDISFCKIVDGKLGVIDERLYKERMERFRYKMITHLKSRVKKSIESGEYLTHLPGLTESKRDLLKHLESNRVPYYFLILLGGLYRMNVFIVKDFDGERLLYTKDVEIVHERSIVILAVNNCHFEPIARKSDELIVSHDSNDSLINRLILEAKTQ